MKLEKSGNKIFFAAYISRHCYLIERTFGSIARYKGMAKVHTEQVLKAIAYNLKFAESII
ncbi:MAG: hypothetical protein HPY79_11170 [Bacteroidales bacterium]|nr:hypothetical protein [Bacteroidales bacterium]